MNPAADASALFREVNEQIRSLSKTFALRDDEHLRIICECVRSDCAEPIDVTMSEYDSIRSGPARYAIKPNHLSPRAGAPESMNDRYWLVTQPASVEQERLHAT